MKTIQITTHYLDDSKLPTPTKLDMHFHEVPIKLPQELKAEWLAALRSGSYKQGIKQLCFDEEYCCLGVLSHLQSRLQLPFVGAHFKLDGYQGSSNVLTDDNPQYRIFNQSYEGRQSVMNLLTRLNDQGATFSEIADVIDYIL